MAPVWCTFGQPRYPMGSTRWGEPSFRTDPCRTGLCHLGPAPQGRVRQHHAGYVTPSIDESCSPFRIDELNVDRRKLCHNIRHYRDVRSEFGPAHADPGHDRGPRVPPSRRLRPRRARRHHPHPAARRARGEWVPVEVLNLTDRYLALPIGAAGDPDRLSYDWRSPRCRRSSPRSWVRRLQPVAGSPFDPRHRLGSVLDLEIVAAKGVARCSTTERVKRRSTSWIRLVCHEYQVRVHGPLGSARS
jgi:hypothetical protein